MTVEKRFCKNKYYKKSSKDKKKENFFKDNKLNSPWKQLLTSITNYKLDFKLQPSSKEFLWRDVLS